MTANIGHLHRAFIMNNLKKCATAAIFAAAGMLVTTSASAVFIGFEVNQANYVPTPGVRHNIKDEFAPIGIVFADVLNPANGVTVGKCGPGNGAVSLFGFGADFAGCGNTRPNFNVFFVDRRTR